MNTWLTTIQIKSGRIEDFLAVTVPFASACMGEAGMVSFALLQRMDNPACFSLFEVYHNDPAREAHFNSAHFLAWQKAAGPLFETEALAQPYTPIFPPPEDWERHMET